MKKLLAITLGAMISGASVLSLANEEAPSVTTSAINETLQLLQGKGGNVLASIGADGILIIDDDYKEYASAYHQALKEVSKSAGLPRFVINTHWHSDHVGGNEYWGTRGAVIMAHENVYQRMSTRQEMKAFNRVVEASPGAALPVVTYDRSSTVRFNKQQIELQHFAQGHTDGDSVVFFVEDNVVHMGDHYFKDRFPFVDIGSGGNVFGYTANVAAILKRVDDQTVIVPGHGSLASKTDLERYLNMLETTSAEVSSKLDQGLSLEQITEQGLGKQWVSWGQGFIDEAAWIQFIAGSR